MRHRKILSVQNIFQKL